MDACRADAAVVVVAGEGRAACYAWTATAVQPAAKQSGLGWLDLVCIGLRVGPDLSACLLEAAADML